MRTIADDLAVAQAENSPSIAAAVKAAIDKEGPQPVEQIEETVIDEAALEEPVIDEGPASP